jgi:hypothetical protein
MWQGMVVVMMIAVVVVAAMVVVEVVAATVVVSRICLCRWVDVYLRLRRRARDVML